jgi:acyl carrier protein
MSAFYVGLAEIFEVAETEIGPDFDLKAHKWDSLAVVSVIALVDECFHRLIDGAALARCATVADVQALVDKAQTA